MTKLIVDKNHKRIDASMMGNSFKKLESESLGKLVELSIYSGAMPKLDKLTRNNNKSQNLDDSSQKIK